MSTAQTQRGSLLIITLWMVTILSAFAIAIARYLSVELRVTRYRTARTSAEVMARSGVYVAMARLAADGSHGDELYDWPGDPDWAFVQGDGAQPGYVWELRAPGASVEAGGQLHGSRALVRISDEGRKVNVGQAPTVPAVVTAISSWLHSDELAARVVDYIDGDQNRYVVAESGIAGMEADQSANPPYMAKNGPLSRVEELFNIPGFSTTPGVLIEKFSKLTSLYLGEDAMNINTIEPDVLRALGISEYTIGVIDQFRQGTDGLEAHEQDGKFEQPGQPIVEKLAEQGWTVADATQNAKEQEILSGMGVASQVFTVESTGESALAVGKTQTAVTAHVQAVVRRKECGQGVPEPCILAWNEW